MTLSADGHQWLSLNDPSGSTWLIDLDFMRSCYSCIYGRGCPSNGSEPDPSETLGCCGHGAHFVDEEDHDRVVQASTRLGPDEWQNLALARHRGGPTKSTPDSPPSLVTRIANGACIFLNRADFRGGGGCALHIGAINRGERPIDWKPAVCWQVPIRLDVHEDDYDHETVLVRAWERRDWGPGGEDFHWWCTEAPEAFTGSSPLYQSSREELVELMGQATYDKMVEHLEGDSGTEPAGS